MILRRSYNRYERDKVVSFVPPDGQFELMRYRPTTSLTSLVPPLFCQPQVSIDPTSTQGHISVTIGVRADTTLIIPNRAKGAAITVLFHFFFFKIKIYLI